MQTLNPSRLSAEELLNHLAPAFEPDCADYTREFSRYRFVLRHVLPLLPAQASVLDLGAGPGVIPLALREVGASVTVADKWDHYRTADSEPAEGAPPSRMGLLPVMRERYARSGVVMHELDLVNEPLRFADESFDMVLLLAVIEHLPKSPKRLLEEVTRVLKPGGVFILEVPNIAALRNRIKLAFGKSIHFPLDDWYYSEPYCGHYRELTRGEVLTYMKYAGLEPLWVRMSDTPFHNTKLANGYYRRGFQLNSLFQWMKLVYLLACLLVPSWRFQILAAGRKPQHRGPIRS